MKKILSLVLSVILVVSLFPSRNVFAVGEFTIRGIDASAFPGEQVSVDIMLENNPGISAINLYYIFDADYLTLTKVENKVSSFAMTHVTTTVWDSVSNFADDGVLGTLHFDIAENTPAGEYEVEIMFLSASNDEFEEVVAQTVSATVVVQETGCSHAAKREVPAKSATCEKGGNRRYYVCDSCGLVLKADGVTETTVAAEQIPALGHSFTGWTVIQEPTTSKEGLEIRTCTRCDYEEQRTVPKLDGPAVIASGTCGDNLTWTLTDDGCLTISGSGAMYDYYDESVPWNKYRANITSVMIDENMTTIGSYAFYNCDGLSSVEIPDSVTTIGDHAFYACSSLSSVEIPDSVTIIDHGAFLWCDSLSSVVIGNSVTTIGDFAFRSCDKLSSVEIPDSVTSIGLRAFEFCEGLSSVVIGNGVTTIDKWAFADCDSLSSVEIPESVTTIGDGAFELCGSLSEINVDGNNPSYSSDDRGVLFDKQKSTLIQAPGAISGSYTIPESVTTIVDSAFAYCDSLSRVEIPDSMTTIGKEAFFSCNGLSSVVIGNSVATIDYYTFAYCDSLISVEIPDSVTTIGDHVFYACSSLSTVIFRGDAPTIDSDAFYKVSVTAYYPADNSTWTEDVMQDYGGDITWVELEPELDPGLVYVVYEDHVEITDYTGTGTEIVIPARIEGLPVTVIGDRAFYDCYRLTSVEIGNSVTAIGNSAFYDCYNLTSVEIPDSVTAIGSSAFGYCGNLSGIQVNQNNSYYSSDDRGVLFDKQKQTLIQAPGAISGSYTIPDSVITIGESAFHSCDGLTSVEIGDSVTTIGDDVFAYCYDLTSVEIGDSVTTIGDDAFAYCYDLASVEIGDSVTTIGKSAFRACERMSSVEIPDSVITIGNYAFYYCCSLTSVEIGDSVTTIGDCTFAYCERLSAVIFRGDAPTIDSGAFDDVTVTAYYPAYNSTWTTDVMQDYGGTITWVADASGHVHEYTAVVTAPTCTKQGYTTHTCRCGASYVDSYAAALGHSFTNYVSNGDATCTEDGTKTAVCDRCNVRSTVRDTGSATGHHYKGRVTAPTCTERGYTTYTCECGDSYIADYIDALGHNMGKWTTQIAATCTKIGQEIRECSRCDHSETRTVDALGHNWDNGVVTIEPTEDSEGLRTYTCRRCAQTRTEVIPALDHEHHYEAVVTAPTCTERGYTTHTCRCGDSYVDSYTAALGHSFTGWTVVQEPTTSKEGLETRTCTRCDYEEQRTVPKLETPDLIASGICGDDLVWELTVDGCLTISGTGAMYDFGSFDSPWYDYKEQILSVVIEDGATSIGDYAFNYCANVSSIQIPDSVTVIGSSAFDDCNSLPALILPDNLVSIGSHAFYDCTSLTSIVIPASVTTIGDNAFWDCESLEEIVVESANRDYSSRDGVLYNKQQTSLVVYPAGKAGTFNVPASVTRIEDWAFYGAAKLSGVTIPDHVKYIGDSAFRECRNLAAVEIPTGIYTISGYTFCFCDSLTQITIPSNIRWIDRDAFAYCDNLEQITFEGDAPEFEEDVFLGVTAEAYYPADNATWTVDVRKSYGGRIVWLPYEEKTLPFTDVPDGSFFYEPVAWAVEHGITTGATATTFNPNGTCLRAHVVTFLYRAAGNPEPFSSNNPFSDVKTSDFFYKPVLWAVDKGITNGTTATTFGSFANCNRAAVVTFLWRAAGSPEPQSTSHPFVDVKTTDFFYKPVLWAVEKGITNGVDATHFGPTTDCNRAQVVTFLYRVYT